MLNPEFKCWLSEQKYTPLYQVGGEFDEYHSLIDLNYLIDWMNHSNWTII